MTTVIADVRDMVAKIPESVRSIKPHVLEAQRFIGNASNFGSLQGLRAQLESIVLSDFGKLVTNCKHAIKLYDAVRYEQPIFMFLDTRRFGETARTIGKFILQDLKSVSAKIDAEHTMDQRKRYFVIIDEFADLAQEDFIGFLDRARSSKISVVISHQEIADLKRISPEFAARVTGNTSTLYAFLQKNPESAEFVSGLAGTQTTMKTTYQTEKFLGFDRRSGGESEREVEEFIIHPNRVKSLRVGECVVVKKYPHSRAHVVKVHSDG